MSESKEHKRRYNQRLEYIARFTMWLESEPPMWRVIAWRRWKRNRPLKTEIFGVVTVEGK